MTDHKPENSPEKKTGPSVERLYPFALRARVVVVGEALLNKLRKKLHFILVTRDLSEKRLSEMLRSYSETPILQIYETENIEEHFGFKNTKILGFKKSSLAVSIYRELKEKAERLNTDDEAKKRIK